MQKKDPIVIGKRDFSKPNHWQNIELGNFKITKPTIICLGGNCTITTEEANGVCKVASSLIGLKNKFDDEQATTQDVDVIGIAYGSLENSDNPNTTMVTKQEIGLIVDTLLMPLAFDEQGNRYSFEQAQRNFCNLNFFSHCYGSKVLNEMNFDLMRKMLSQGYSSRETLDLEKQMTSVAYAPMEEVFNMTAVQAISLKDLTTAVPSNANAGFQDAYLDIVRGNTVFSGTSLFIEDENTVTLFTSSMSPKPGNEHAINFIARDERWRYGLLNPDHGDEVSQVLGYALATAVATGLQNEYSQEFIPKPTTEQIYLSAKDILSPFEQQDLGISQ